MTRRRRRRNPLQAQSLVSLAVLGGAAYLFYKVFGAGKAAATAVGEAFTNTSSGLADWLDKVFPHGGNNVQFASGSTILLPSGSVITPDLVSGAGQFTAVDGSQQIQFYFGGKIYRTSVAPDDSNTYYAK